MIDVGFNAMTGIGKVADHTSKRKDKTLETKADAQDWQEICILERPKLSHQSDILGFVWIAWTRSGYYCIKAFQELGKIGDNGVDLDDSDFYFHHIFELGLQECDNVVGKRVIRVDEEDSGSA